MTNPTKTEAVPGGIDAAAKILAERMDYPWAHMPEKGRQSMREIAAAVLAAAPQPARCEYCDGTGDVNGRDGEWRGRCICDAGQQLKPAQPSEPSWSDGVRACAPGPMTTEGAAYFFRRFKHDEKLLGPNEQEAIDYVLSILAAQSSAVELPPSGLQWLNVAEHGIPEIGEEVIGGLWYTDPWLKPEFATRFMWGKCRVVEGKHRDFKDGKRLLTFGPSHNDITHWARINLPVALAAQKAGE